VQDQVLESPHPGGGAEAVRHGLYRPGRVQHQVQEGSQGDQGDAEAVRDSVHREQEVQAQVLEDRDKEGAAEALRQGLPDQGRVQGQVQGRGGRQQEPEAVRPGLRERDEEADQGANETADAPTDVQRNANFVRTSQRQPGPTSTSPISAISKCSRPGSRKAASSSSTSWV